MNIKKAVAVAVVSALIVSVPLAFAPSTVQAQDRHGVLSSVVFNPKTSFIARGVGSDDSDVALLVKYVGTSASGKVEVSVTTGDITFTSGASGSEAASTALECPVSAPLGGIIDVSNAACDTLGEVVDIINASTDWRAVIIDGLRTDSADAAMVTMAATAANRPDGLELKWDTSQAFKSTQLVAPPAARKMTFYLKDRSTMIENPFAGLTTVLFNADFISTYGSGTSQWQFVCDTPVYKTGGGSSTTTTYARTAAATATANNLSFPYGLGCPAGARAVSALRNSAAASSTYHYVSGIQF